MENLIESKPERKHCAIRTLLIDDIVTDASSEMSSRVGPGSTERPGVAPKPKPAVKPKPEVKNKPLERKKPVVKPKPTRRAKSAMLKEPPHTDDHLIQLCRKFNTLATVDRHERYHVKKTESESSTVSDASYNIVCDATKYEKGAVSEARTDAKPTEQSLQQAINDERKSEKREKWEGATPPPVKPKPKRPRKPLKTTSATVVRSFALNDDNGESYDVREQVAIKSLPTIRDEVPAQDSSSAVVNFNFSPTIEDQLDSMEKFVPHKKQATSREFPDEKPSPGATGTAKEYHERALVSMMYEEAYSKAETPKRQSYREMLLSSGSESSMSCNWSSGSQTSSYLAEGYIEFNV